MKFVCALCDFNTSDARKAGEHAHSHMIGGEMRQELVASRCQKTVYGDRDVWGHQCSNKPIVTHDGKLYCRIHDPEYIAEKRQREHAKWEKEWAEGRERQALNLARIKATNGLTLEELQQVTPELIRAAIAKATQ